MTSEEARIEAEALPDFPGGPEPGLGPVAVVLKVFVALVLFALMGLTCVDVVGRYVFTAPVPGASELTEFGMGLLIFGALPIVTARDDHVTIGLLAMVGGDRLARLQRAVVVATSLLALAIMTWRLWVRGAELARYADTSIYLGIPIAPFAWFMSVMSGLAALALLVQLAARLAPSRRAP